MARKTIKITKVNYGSERNKTEREFAVIAAICRVEGISENTIALIHRIMLDELNSNRRFYNHTLSYDGLKFPDGRTASIDNSPLLDDYLEQFCAPRIEIWKWAGWIEDLDTPEIIMWAQSLKETDRLLLTLLIEDEVKQSEAARILEKHNSAISRKLAQFRKSLAKVLPEHLRKQYIR